MSSDVAVFKRDLLLGKILFHLGAEQSAGLTVQNDFSWHLIRSSRGSPFKTPWIQRQFGLVAQISAYPRCPCLTAATALLAIRLAAPRSIPGSCSLFSPAMISAPSSFMRT